MEDALIIYCSKNSARFQYIISWLFKEQLQLRFTITDQAADVASLPFFISYGSYFPNAFVIPDEGLLWQKGITQQEIKTGVWDELPVLYANTDADNSVPFDILSATFFLLSRYEEYYTYTPDKHNRYPATESILYKNGWLKRPVVDEWVHQLRTIFSNGHGIKIKEPEFRYLPTYDIDIAYQTKGKSLKRNIGSLARSFGSADIKQISGQLSVLLHTRQDPYDTYDWLLHLHKELNAETIFFILAALHTTAFDKNIEPHHPWMQALIKRLSEHTPIGIHPSYYAATKDVFNKEKSTLETICGRPINISRQHYIKSVLPGSYRLLLSAGITTDYSMGYGTHLGFRAGTGQSFFWYDLPNEQTTDLKVYPFCFMDTAAMFYEKLNADDAFQELANMAEYLKTTKSLLITICHNSTFGTELQWAGWKEQYEAFLKKYCSIIS